MDDETWVECVKKLSPGIRQMPVIRDHPDWWTAICMDGFSSHVNVAQALQQFRDDKHNAVKEEAGSSHVNQSYDKDVAKKDKASTKELLEFSRGRINRDVDQWTLLGTLIVAIRNLPTSAWENSFKAVNLHPDHRVPFDCWVDRIGSHLSTGERVYFRKNEDFIFDAMPACWKRLPPNQRQELVDTIDSFYDKAARVILQLRRMRH